MQTKHFPKLEICNVRRVIRFVAWNEMKCLQETIDNHHDRILSSLRPRQSQHEIHTEMLLGSPWNGQWHVKSLELNVALRLFILGQ